MPVKWGFGIVRLVSDDFNSLAGLLARLFLACLCHHIELGEVVCKREGEVDEGRGSERVSGD